MFKNGEYVIYHNTEYIYRYCFENKQKNMVRLVSYDRQSLNDGFYTNKTEEYMQEHGFRCFKDVPRSEITEAYNIRTYAVYKGVNASIVGWKKDNKVELYTNCLYGEDEKEFLKKMEYEGFEFSHGEQGGYRVYAKIVSLDDPDLQLLEHRTELDIDKL